MSDRINIHEHTSAICKQLGLDSRLVRRLDVGVTSVTAEVYKLNENGSKYVDLESGKAAIETHEFEVRA